MILRNYLISYVFPTLSKNVAHSYCKNNKNILIRGYNAILKVNTNKFQKQGFD